MLRKATGCLGAAAVLCVSGVATAATPKQIAVHNDWAAFTVEEQQGKACFIASAPLETKPKNVQRGDIWTVVTHRPWKKVRGEVSIYVGYPFQDASKVDVNIDGNGYEMFTHDETAWAETAADDRKLVDAMRRGNKMVITGLSSRGTTTVDTYSLAGFTAAYKAIDEACPE